MFKLENDYLTTHYNNFLCSYGNVDVSSIISRADFIPETFFVNQKQNGEELLFFRDVSFRDWVLNMITDIITHIDISYDSVIATEMVYQNVLYFLEYKNTASKIANQEFVDVIRRIVAYTLTGDVCSEIHTARMFNSLASRILPFVIKRYRELNLSAQELIKYSIASGLSGLDLKGAPAAASTYVNEGIEMYGYILMDDETAVEEYMSSLNKLYAKTQFTLFDWESFIQLLQEKKKLVWMTDDFIESHFDLLVIASLLRDFEVNIEIIPKNGFHGNDLSYKDLMELLSSDLFPELQPYLHSGKLIVSPFGAKMGAANIRRLSPECVSSIQKAGLLFAKGCRIHEMLQGGLSVDLFSSFYVVRKLSEITSGFLAEQNEAILFHLAPREYAFWGVQYANSRKEKSNETIVSFCASTSADHYKRKIMIDIEEITAEFLRLQSMRDSYIGDKYPLYQEMNMLAQKIEQYTAEQYTKSSKVYKGLTRPDMAKIDSELWALLLNEAATRLEKDSNELSLLDVGMGDGRALEYAFSLGMHVLGIDNSIGFINELQEKASACKIPSNSFLFSSMCDIDVEDNLFDIVRMNASLLHLPIIGKGFTVDLALSEANRVLKNEGLLFILVKYGSGFSLFDTKEGLGKRVYQFYDHALLNDVLTRNGFITVKSVDCYEKRGTETIHWIAQIAQKS